MGAAVWRSWDVMGIPQEDRQVGDLFFSLQNEIRRRNQRID